MDEEVKKASEDLSNQVADLFREEKNPSTFMQPTEYLDHQDKKAFFVSQNKLLILGSILPMAFMPYSFLRQAFTQHIEKSYELQFGKDEEEKAKMALGEFLLGHPRAKKGIIKSAELLKHAGNITTYAAYAGTAGLAYHFLSSFLSYPLVIGSAASGLTMAVNFVKSRGHDSSGIISTLAERKYYHKLE